MEIPWIIQEHTIIKHNILERYLKAWAAILYNQQEKLGITKKLIYFDGFSGPGIYYKDQNKKETIIGSPLIVANIANDFISNDNKKQFIIFCIDENKECLDVLQNELSKLNIHGQKWQILNGSFDNAVNSFILYVESTKIKIAPTFYFIDPFGYSGIPIKTLKKLLEFERSEMLINFMIYDVVRAASNSLMQGNVNRLFGCDDYQKINEYRNPEARQIYLKNLYINQLKNIANVRFITPFRINTPNQGDRPRYYLIHCTNHYRAMKEMKDAMHKNSESEYALEAINVQKDLFSELDCLDFEDLILSHVTSQNGLLTYENIEEWSYINTCGVSKTIKTALISLEEKSKIEIVRLKGQRKTTVTNGAIIKAC